MDPEFWHERWRENQIGFHLPAPHPLLTADWSQIEVRPYAKVLVPLCGKSIDMMWLHEQGYAIIGVELSPIAVANFFQEQGLTPTLQEEPAYTVYRHRTIEILRGDFFNLKADRVKDVDVVYDRASLVAFSAANQARYVEHLVGIIPTSARLLLITLEYDPTEIEGPPFSIPHERVSELYSPHYRISLLSDRDALVPGAALHARGLSWLRERAYLLERKV